ncbi:CpsB/CapC family capsule biosynthesis tyrosine phosphatase [Thermotoga sp.]|uniref:CpsB/CapC family capsule biosynthesis tyrosine phosphatase n=1 Tax=Thermotoga sp. TaxID=28240 RepID=UPI0025E3C90A|nr:CpsB/CapC family capsule biosynthesis tyrosine phosphatase [Thermotoga sp.]MCD6551865.1 hypothetical protein [Thermotoga sp.]
MRMLDVHTHVLFGVDDGVETLEESLDVLKEYKENGMEYIVLTPHINHPAIKSDLKAIKERFTILATESKKFGVELFLGSEVYLTPDVKEFIPINDKFVVIELNTLTYPMYLYDKIFDIQLDGYDVILAHVERYEWLRKNKRVLKKLKDMNVYFQMNIESLEDDKFFTKNGYVDLVGTDYHGRKKGTIDWRLVKKYWDLFENSAKIILGNK